jgi:hypothetical protein
MPQLVVVFAQVTRSPMIGIIEKVPWRVMMQFSAKFAANLALFHV